MSKNGKAPRNRHVATGVSAQELAPSGTPPPPLGGVDELRARDVVGCGNRMRCGPRNAFIRVPAPELPQASE